MELVPKSDVYQVDKRNTKKMLLPTDAVCVRCGIIFNFAHEDECVICEDDDNDGTLTKSQDMIEHVKKARQFVKNIDLGLKGKASKGVCDHKEFIVGRQGVDLRILLDFNMENLRALCEIHGCPEGGSRGRMVVNIMKQLYPNLDKRINENLVRKMIFRNKKRFRFWRDIEDAIHRAKKPGKIQIISADDCIEIRDDEMFKRR